MKRFWKNLIVGVTAFSALAAVGVSLASVSHVKEAEVSAAASTTKTTDATQISYTDKQNWNYRTFHVWGLSYNDGCAHADFENFLTGFYGAKQSSWNKEGTTKGWAINGSSSGDYFICDGSTTSSHAITFPWWVQAFTFQVVNNGNWQPSSGYGINSGWGYHNKVVCEIDGTSFSYKSMSAFTYSFPAVTITKKAVDSSTKQVISGVSLGSDTTSIYDKYPNGLDNIPEPDITVDGYLFDGWYSNQALSTNFTKQRFTSDATVYAKYNECPTVDVFINAFDWSNLYIYTFETIGGNKVEYYGAFPGKHVGFSDSGLFFNGNNKLQKVAVPYTVLANAQFIYSDGTSSHQSSDMNVVSNAYYWHDGSSWTYDSANYAAAAAYVYDLNVERLQVAATSKVKEYSICGLNAKKWVDRYDDEDMSSTAQGYIDAASIWTYKDKESSGADTRVTYSEILVTLRSRYALYSSSNLFGGEEDSASMVTIVAVFVLSAFGITSFFIFQKKKKLNIK